MFHTSFLFLYLHKTNIFGENTDKRFYINLEIIKLIV